MKLNKFNSLTPYGDDGMRASPSCIGGRLVRQPTTSLRISALSTDFPACINSWSVRQKERLAWAFPPDHLQLMVSSIKSALLVIEFVRQGVLEVSAPVSVNPEVAERLG